jgi:hypothetical protein
MSKFWVCNGEFFRYLLPGSILGFDVFQEEKSDLRIRFHFLKEFPKKISKKSSVGKRKHLSLDIAKVLYMKEKIEMVNMKILSDY